MASDREKALDVALGAIEKQFGKGAIMRMGEGAKQKVAVIPTGAIGLDVALGTGGFPRGRVCEIYGPESSGKCVPAGTYIWTDEGLETIEELFARVGQPASCTSRVTDVRDAGVHLVNEEGDLEQLAAVTHNNRRPTWSVTVESGRTVTATANHPLRVLNERGEIVWRRVSDLAAGDVLVSAAFGADEAGTEGLSPAEATLLGYLVSEGTLGERHSFTFTNHHDADVVEEYHDLLEDVLGIDRDRVRVYGPGDYRVHDTAARARLADEYGLTYTRSAGKAVPHCVRTGGRKAQRAFLSALFEGDGWVEDGPEIALTSASLTLVEQVQLMLLGLGIPCSRGIRRNEDLQRDYHTVRIPPGSVDRFLATVGFRSARRAEQVGRHVSPGLRTATRWEAVPFIADLVRDLRDAVGGDRELDCLYHDLTRSDLTSDGSGIGASRRRLRDIVAWADARHIPSATRPLVERLRAFAEGDYTYERITCIEDAGLQPTFDVMVPETHSFLANGVLSHNTTVALHAIAEAQKQGGIAAFIDAEHALDPAYAAALGVDVDQLLVSQPDTGEQALEITDTLVRSGAVDLLVIDSVAALTPRAEIEGEMGDTHVGLQARLMSQALRKLAGHLNRSKTCCIFINQLREKVGVMFGCFHYSTRVTLADGTQEKIGKLVNQRRDVEVLSYNPDTGDVEPRRIINWYDNGPTDEFLQFTVAKPGKNGRAQFAATPNHLIATPGGWRSAEEIAVGDRVLQEVTTRLSPMQWDVLLGTLMGDGALSRSRSGLAARYRFGHGAAQVEYADWKASLWHNIPSSRTTDDRGAVFYDFTPLPELAEVREAMYWPTGKVLSDDYLKRLTPLSLALWYCDDGSFAVRSKGLQERTRGGSGRIEICVQAIEPSSRERLRDHLADTFGIGTTLVVRGGNAILQFPTAETAKFQELVAPYVHPSMDYKLLPRFRGRFGVEVETCEPRRVLKPMPVLDVHVKPPSRATHRFDLEIEGNANYFVDGVMVHNSPETTPGGRALKFYSSVRLDIRRIESLKDGQDFVGNRVRVKVVKNKVAPPFKKVEFDIMFGEGISKEGSLIDMGVEHGIIRKAGAWYTYDGEQLGQGRENARTFLKEHDDVAAEIYKKTVEMLGLVQTDASGDEALLETAED
ncbi:LAGLIDADG family homing endonuclease [Euzebya sp.]|uniref:LAGLIDADG family homing endonuclease n=1 Tax=Euzebya sp. TaxID=1971409 RepID=UPI00351886DC